MTAATIGPAPASAGAGLWDYTLVDLQRAGVTLTDAQLAALNGYDNHLLIAWALPDPYLWSKDLHGETMAIPPMVFTDGTRPTIPAVAMPVWEEAELLEQRYGPLWRRFPSIPVRVVIPDAWDEVEPAPRYARVWDVTPLPPDALDDVNAVSRTAWLTSDYDAHLRWSSATLNDLNYCDLAVQMLRPNEAHRHVIRQGMWVHCIDGEEMYNELTTQLYEDGDPQRPRSFPVSATFRWHSSARLWEHLKSTSQFNAEQALQTVPPWLVEELRADEQRGGRPWW